jgi:hypothetical protein
MNMYPIILGCKYNFHPQSKNIKNIEPVNFNKTDPILVWMKCALDAVKSAGSNGKPGVAPTTGTRLTAMLSVAMLDTVASFGDKVKPYLIDIKASKTLNRDVAIIGAAHRILSTELPGEANIISTQLSKSLKNLKLSKKTIVESLNFGYSIANKIIKSRENDGSTNKTSISYPLGDYVWRPAESGPTAGVALGTNWGSVKPWITKSPYKTDGLQARPDVDLNLYANQLNEVRLYGGLNNTSLTTLQRTPDQTEIALFWAYDRPDTFRPYGQLIDIAMDVSKSKKSSIETNAKLLASLTVAMADSVISAWKEKYTYLQPRPYDVITGSFSDTDGTPVTVRDTQWRTLLSSINGIESPPFPDFISGHSVMGGAFSSVMSHFYGDNVVFSAGSQELPGITRTFRGFTDNGVYRNSFYQAGLEDALSRIYGGVHIREAALDSFDLGLNIGSAINNSVLG